MKIVDCFTFYNELDMLEFRLNELDNVVDFFVLVECTNKDKELYFENNKSRFSKFLHKIIHIIVKDNIPQTSNAWDIEHYQRRCIDRGIRQLELTPDDIIIISDLDEIPDSNTLQDLKFNRLINGIYSLRMDLYYYNLRCKYNTTWEYSKVLNYGSYNGDPQAIRCGSNLKGNIENGGWHFSYFGNVEFIKNKIRSFAHQDVNNSYVLNDARITKQIQNSCDLFERNEYKPQYIDIKSNTYLPKKYKEFLHILDKKL
jgi:beta-1,4-mannosyl-glycoprotein beta-1,4-N-acetylglucosaminyltransferase